MSQADYQSVSERSIDDVRVEWVPETTPGVVPSDPAWNLFGDYIKGGPGWSPDAGAQAGEVVGNSDTEDHFRGSFGHELTISWWMQRFPVDNSGNANDPIGTILNRDPGTTLDTHTVVWRRDVSTGGTDSAGYRDYTFARGAYPTSGDAPGDPSSGEPIVQEVGYTAAIVERHVISQPSTGSTLTVSSSDASDTTQTLTIEDEGASTTEDVDLNGTTDVTTTATFADIDAAYLDGECVGDVTITDGSGTTYLTIYGSDTDGIEGQRGVPALGSGSHASAIGTDPDGYLFQGTSSTFGGALDTPTRIGALNLSLSIDTSTQELQGTRQMAINPGQRTVTLDVDTQGPYDSATNIREFLQGVSGDVTYSYPDGDVVVKNATPQDVDDQDYSPGDASVTASMTLEGHGDPAVTATHN